MILDPRMRLSGELLSAVRTQVIKASAQNPNWGVIGLPNRNFDNTQDKNQASLGQLDQLTDQLLIIRQSSNLTIDKDAPGLRGGALNLTLECRRRALPVIAAEELKKSLISLGYEKILSIRKTHADKALAVARYNHLISGRLASGDQTTERTIIAPAAYSSEVSNPTIAVSRGGGGSRLLAQMLQDLGLFLGNKLNPSLDSLEMVQSIYLSTIRKLSQGAPNWVYSPSPELRRAAENMIRNRASNYGKATLPLMPKWGFKLPESVFVLPELHRAFPGARFIQMVRDPLRTCLRPPHITANPGNELGRLSLNAAYRFIGRDLEKISRDTNYIRMAATTAHQLEMASTFLSKMSNKKALTIRFEDLIAAPRDLTCHIGSWLDAPKVSDGLHNEINQSRAAKTATDISAQDLFEIEEILFPIRSKLGYR